MGNKEGKSKNPYFRKIEDLTNKQYNLLKKDSNIIDIIFEMYEGGHFKENEFRIAKEFNGI